MYRNKNRNTVTKSVVGQLHCTLKKKKTDGKKNIKSSQKKRHIRQRNEHKDDSRLPVRNNVSQIYKIYKPVQQVYKMGVGDNTVRIMY